MLLGNLLQEWAGSQLNIWQLIAVVTTGGVFTLPARAWLSRVQVSNFIDVRRFKSVNVHHTFSVIVP